MTIDTASQARARYWRIQLLVAIFFGVVAFFLFWWYLDSLQNGSVLGLIATLEIFIGGRMLHSVFQYYQPKRTLSFNALLILALLSLIVGHVTQFLAFQMLDLQGGHFEYLNPELHIAFLFFVLWVLYYEWWFLKNELIQNQNTQRLLTLKEDLKNAEIRVIQQNVQPHFLFNSLNSINSLILIDQLQAQEMVVRLSEFLRHSVIKNQKMFVSLKEEIEQINRYFSIEQIRFASRLKCNLLYDEKIDNVQIPSMILQPLVENAIKHGLYGQTNQTHIELKFETNETHLLVTMSNPFDRKAFKKKGAGFGLEGIKKKLYLLFAENDLLQTEMNDNTFITHLKIPLNHERIDH